MVFLNALFNTVVQFLLMIGVVVAAIALGVTLRKKKDASSKEE